VLSEKQVMMEMRMFELY